jgi:hypothetical protein
MLDYNSTTTLEYIHIRQHGKFVTSVYGESAYIIYRKLANFHQQLISENNMYVIKGDALLLLCYFEKVFTVTIEDDSLEDF